MTPKEDKNMLSRITKVDVRYLPDNLVEAYLLGFEQGRRELAAILESVCTVRSEDKE
jgi:hypothetical protein